MGNLPAELNSFVGRRGELSTAKALLGSGRLLTLTGMGGVGKTRLARRVLAEVRRAFRDGVWQAELAELHEPALVAASIASAMGLHEPPGGWTIGTLQERLAGRHVLLLLDNCEHLIDACAVTVDALLRACPELSVIATSRQPLGIDGEQTLAVAPLPTPDPEQKTDLARLQEFDAAQLFLARAGAVLPGFALDRQNQQAVAALCHRLEGLPLALEFAALQVRALSPEQIVTRLDQESRLSAKGSRIAPPRQQSLRALVDWSFQLCSEPERVLWKLLSVFTGEVDLEAVEFVCAGSAVADADLVELVVGLVNKSVLTRETWEGRVCYRMAEVIRDYCRERLTEAEERSARRQHRDWYVTLTARAYAEFAGAEQLSWFTRLRREHGDIRAALGFCVTDPEGAEPAAEILLSLLDCWIAFGFVSEGRHWADQLLRKTAEPGLLRARLLRASAYLAMFQGDLAVAALDEARTLAERDGSQTELAWIAHAASLIASATGDFATCDRMIEQAVVGLRAAGDLHGLLGAVANRAVRVAVSGDLAATEVRVAEFLALAEPLGERWVRSYVLWALGIAAWRAGDGHRATALEVDSLRMRLPFDDRMGVSLCAEVLAWVAARDGEAERGAMLLGAARRAAEAIGVSVPPFALMVDDHEECENRLMSGLGNAAFETAVRRGAELRDEQVLDLAAGSGSGEPAAVAEGVAKVVSPLTRREQQIADLVAQGLSNKEIAQSLVIAPRTAEGHVEHILVKLGFTSRSQIAAWVAERRR